MRRAIRLFLFVGCLATLIAAAVGGTSSTGTQLGSKPELHPIAIVLEPAVPVERGQDVRITVQIINSGDEDAKQEFIIEFLRRRMGEDEGWIPFATRSQAGLPISVAVQAVPVEAVLSTTELLNPEETRATFEIRVVVDANDQVSEKDELNNEIRSTVTVQQSPLGKADLKPLDLRFPGATFPILPQNIGSNPIQIESEIKNIGERDASAFDVQFSYCQFNPLSTQCGQFVPFDSERLTGGLAQGGTLTVPAQLDPAPLGPGIFKVRVLVDPPTTDAPLGAIDERDEANNEIIGRLTIDGAELHPVGITFDSDLVRRSSEVKVRTQVENTGGASAEFSVIFKVNEVLFASTSLNLEGGRNDSGTAEGTLRTAELPFPPDGQGRIIVQISVEVDPDRRVPELDETNNSMSTQLTIHPALPPQAELHPKSITLTPSSPFEPETSCPQVQPDCNNLTVSSDIVNSGAQLDAEYVVQFAYRPRGQVRWNSFSITKLSAAGSREQSITGQLDLSDPTRFRPGVYEFRVLVDSDNRVPELDETNNELSATFTILGKADLVPRELQVAPQVVGRRATVQISLTVHNEGEKPSGAFEVQLLISRADKEGFDCPFTLEAELTPICVTPKSFGSLDLGAAIPVTFELDTTLVRPGNYQVVIAVDPPSQARPLGQVDEGLLGETNNLSMQLDLFITGPDLTFKEKPAPLELSQGQKATIRATIENQGSDPAGAFRVEFALRHVDEPQFRLPFDVQEFDGLDLNRPVVIEKELDILAQQLLPGKYEVRITIDPASDGRPFGQVEEQAEDNNQAWMDLVIVAPRDLADLSVRELTFTPSAPKTYQTIQVTAVIENRGTQQARDFLVSFIVKRPDGSEEEFGNADISQLQPGSLLTIGRRLAAGVAGNYLIRVVVDPTNSVKEQDESNNELSKTLFVSN